MELQQLTICSCRTAFPLFGLHMASPLLRNPISSKSAAEQGVIRMAHTSFVDKCNPEIPLSHRIC